MCIGMIVDEILFASGVSSLSPVTEYELLDCPLWASWDGSFTFPINQRRMFTEQSGLLDMDMGWSTPVIVLLIH